MIEYNEGYHTYYVYIITNKYRSTYYIGMTNNLGVRLQQHKENIEKGLVHDKKHISLKINKIKNLKLG